MLGNASGVSRLKVLILLVVLGLAFTQGIKYLAMQLDYQRLKDEMETKASVAQVLKDEEILTDLAVKARDLNLPLNRENFEIIRDEDRRVMTIRTAWDVEITYLWGLCGDSCNQTYHFEPVVSETYGK